MTPDQDLRRAISRLPEGWTLGLVCGALSLLVISLFSFNTLRAQDSSPLRRVTQEMSREELERSLSRGEAAQGGRSLAQRMAQRLEDRQLQQWADRYASAGADERALLREHIGGVVGAERLREALARDGGDRAPIPEGRFSGVIRPMGRFSRYMAFVPPGYTPERAWPVHISLHGGGGNPLRNCEEHWQGEAARDGVILVCPSTNRAMWWMPLGEETVLAALEDVRLRFRVDPERVSIGGASSGGFGVWHMSMKYPWLFRAAVPRCAATPNDPAAMANLGALPVYMLHGARDGQINVLHSRRSQEIMDELGVDFTYTEDPRAGHRFMSDHNEEILDWMRDHRRAAWGPFRYRTLERGEAPGRVHWVRPDWGDSYAAGLELEGRLVARDVAGRKIREVHLTSTAPLRSATILLPPDPDWSGDEPVMVYYNNRLISDHPALPSVEAVLESWIDHRDPALVTGRALRIWPQSTPAGPFLGRLAP
jgi:acetyl esterase/lipase